MPSKKEAKGISIEKSQKQKDLEQKKGKKNVTLDDVYELLLEIREEQLRKQ